MDHNPEELLPLTSPPRSFLCSLNLPKLPLPELLRSPYSTSEHSVTMPASRVADIVQHKNFGLKELYFCDEMTDRAFCYVDYPSFAASMLQPRPKHCSECPDAPEQPPEDYTIAHMQLGNIGLAQLGRTDIVMLKDNESVREAVNELIFKAVNLALKLRYNNTAPQQNMEQDQQSCYRDSENQPLEYDGIQNRVYSPVWTRPTGHNHIIQSTKKAGYSDRILLRSMLKLDPQDVAQTQVAINESKAFWCYTTPHLQALLNGSDQVLNNDNTFNSEGASTHAGNALIQQVYGESLYLGPKIGFITNGHIVILFYRIGPEPSPAELKAIAQTSGHKTSLSAEPEDLMQDYEEEEEPFERETDSDQDGSGTFRHRGIPAPSETRRSLRSASRIVTFKVDTDDVKNHMAFSGSEEQKDNASSSPIPNSEPGKKGGLVLSRPIKWTDERLLRCIIGLTYLALDEEAWKEGHNGKNAQEILCPVEKWERITRRN